jgi:hemerythrin
MEEMHLWDDRLDLGYDALDREHHLQLALVGALSDALERGRPRLARQVVEQLAGYSSAHFAGEEMLMETASYCDLASHRQEHRDLLAQIAEMQQLVTSGERDLAVAMALDLRAELGSHMSASDRRFAELCERPRRRQ